MMLFSLGALHYYATLKIYTDVIFKATRDNRREPADRSWGDDKRRKLPPHLLAGEQLSGLMGIKPEYSQRHQLISRLDRIEITRPWDKHDFAEMKRMNRRLDGGEKIGEPTTSFWTPQEALDAGIKFFKKNFTTGWTLKLDHRYNSLPQDFELTI